MLVLKSLLLTLPFSICYCAGGQGPKYMRRFIGPSILSSVVILCSVLSGSFSWLVGLGALAYFAAANGFSYGSKYTHDKTGLKILFRGLCGASYGLCGLLIGVGAGHALIGLSQLILATDAAILFGVLNPFGSKLGNFSTILEDCCISYCYVILLVFAL